MNEQIPGVDYLAIKNRPKVIRPPAKTLTYKGRTMSMLAWAKELGVANAVLYGRKSRGWSDARIIEEPSKNVFSVNRTVPTKSEAMMWVDENKCPVELAALAKRIPVGVKKPGRYMRDKFPAAFDKWYVNYFSKGFYDKR